MVSEMGLTKNAKFVSLRTKLTGLAQPVNVGQVKENDYVVWNMSLSDTGRRIEVK